MAAMLALGSHAFAQSEDVDPEMRIQQLENQLRQLTGQNEELQYRNRQLEERLRRAGRARRSTRRRPAQHRRSSPDPDKSGVSAAARSAGL
jgi:TolA-binding protein